MVKLVDREMKNLSRILTVVLCCAPVVSYGAGPVATTSGSNLTSYNPSTAYNNQWATMSNGRYDTDNTAKVDFGNCNAVVLRCAQPKCAGGGCTDYNVAGAIVEGCVKSNDKCKQYGDDLISYMTAQLVASSNAKINEQQMALESAKIQAEAQAAAASAANSQNEQMISQMQNQMAQMQQQMAQQQQESNRQLQEALAQQAAQSAAAIESMKNTATEVAQQNESGITSYQQEAINRGISTDVLERQKITGQIMTEIENADLKLKNVRVAMQNSFDYAGCDARGNNCRAPKRIKKWRELATGFLDPYDETIDRIYDALVTAQTVGVDLSQIYMMLNNSCNSWGRYLCEKGSYIDYGDGNGAPRSCSAGVSTDPETRDCLEKCNKRYDKLQTKKDATVKYNYDNCVSKCAKRVCKPCTLIKLLTDKDEDAVYEGWINPTADVQQNGTVVACASNALDGSTLFARRTKNKNGAGLVDIDKLDKWLTQVEPSTAQNGKECDSSNNSKNGMCYCGVGYGNSKRVLELASAKKSVNNITGVNDYQTALCVTNIFSDAKLTADRSPDECTEINPIYAICDTHPYNAKMQNTAQNNDNNLNGVDTNAQEQMNEIIGLKITVVSQQMYKQYEYLRATLQRLKIQLEKSVLSANLEAAGGKTVSFSSSGLLGGGIDGDKTIHLAGANNCSNFMDFDSAYNCLQNNVTVIKNNVSSNTNKACLQLQSTVSDASSILEKENIGNSCTNYNVSASERSCKDRNKENIVACANEINMAVMKEKRDLSQKTKNRGIGD